MYDSMIHASRMINHMLYIEKCKLKIHHVVFCALKQNLKSTCVIKIVVKMHIYSALSSDQPNIVTMKANYFSRNGSTLDLFSTLYGTRLHAA